MKHSSSGGLKLEQKFGAIPGSSSAKPDKRSPEEVWGEILETVRGLGREVASIKKEMQAHRLPVSSMPTHFGMPFAGNVAGAAGSVLSGLVPLTPVQQASFTTVATEFQLMAEALRAREQGDEPTFRRISDFLREYKKLVVDKTQTEKDPDKK
jgi:hypothetical protein